MPKRANAVDVRDPVSLILHHFVLENGKTYGQCAAKFQREFFRAVFAVNPDGTPKHRLCYSERRRGESKTEDVAAVALADLYVGPPRHRSFVVAGDADQAGLVTDSIAGFVSRSPLLQQDIEIQKTVVRNRATGAELKIMSSDDRTAFGVRPRRVYFEELSLQQDNRLWLAFWSAIGKRADAQMVATSMAGWDFSSLGWEVREMARETPDYFFQTREGTELAPWISPKAVEEMRRTLHPADFARYYECRWVEPAGSWITREMFDAAAVGREALRGNPEFSYVGFVDVGLTHDPSVVAVVHGEGERVILDTLRTLRGTRSQPVELEALEDVVIELTKAFRVKHWIFESPQAVASVQRLQRRLPHVRVEVRYPTAETQAQLFGTLYQLFANHRLVVFPHEGLRREALNLITKTVGGRLKVVESTSVHQDHVVALGGAAEMVVSRPFQDWTGVFGVVECPNPSCGFPFFRELPDGTSRIRCPQCGHALPGAATLGDKVAGVVRSVKDLATGAIERLKPQPQQADNPAPASVSAVRHPSDKNCESADCPCLICHGKSGLCMHRDEDEPPARPWSGWLECGGCRFRFKKGSPEDLACRKCGTSLEQAERMMGINAPAA